MSVYDDITAMSDRLVAANLGRISNLIRLYSKGVEAKLSQAEYALEILNDICSPTESIHFQDDPNFSVQDKMHFYLDSFFAFLYSTFDVISQIVNQQMGLQIDERFVSFKRVSNALNNNHSGTQTQIIFSKIRNSHFFKRLDKYRNCSTHRRQIYIESRSTQIIGTPGYATTGNIDVTTHYLCDDPYKLNPKTGHNRELIAYCESKLERAKKEISKISKIL